MPKLIVTRKSFSGAFLSIIKTRQQQWQSVGGSLAAQIIVPPDMKWWYWQEFGTAQRGDPGRASGVPYDVLPVDAKAIRFPDARVPNTADGSRVQAALYNQPGIPPKHFVTRSLAAIIFTAAMNFQEVGRKTQYDVEAIRTDLLTRTMVQAKDKITAAMAESLTGVRIDGKLHGLPAAALFESNAQIRNVGV